MVDKFSQMMGPLAEAQSLDNDQVSNMIQSRIMQPMQNLSSFAQITESFFDDDSDEFDLAEDQDVNSHANLW